MPDRPVDVLVIPDGAAQPPRAGVQTALEAAATPVLDELAAQGAVVRVASTPTGLPAGSETGIAALLGAAPRQVVGRGWVDAAAYGVEVPEGLTPWRADLVYRSGRRASIRQAREVCSHLGAGAHAVAGHRLLLVDRDRPTDRQLMGLHVRVWPGGAPALGPLLVPTTLICARSAAAGCGRLLGARVVVPAGATGDVDTDLRGKAAAALAALADGDGDDGGGGGGGERIVVHFGAPDEAAHRHEAGSVISALERMDAELLAPLRDAIHAAGGRLAVCPDHGTDPVTGLHDGAPVPAVLWGAGVVPRGPRKLSERAAAGAPVLAAEDLLPVAAGAA